MLFFWTLWLNCRCLIWSTGDLEWNPATLPPLRLAQLEATTNSRIRMRTGAPALHHGRGIHNISGSCEPRGCALLSCGCVCYKHSQIRFMLCNAHLPDCRIVNAPPFHRLRECRRGIVRTAYPFIASDAFRRLSHAFGITWGLSSCK